MPRKKSPEELELQRQVSAGRERAEAFLKELEAMRFHESVPPADDLHVTLHAQDAPLDEPPEEPKPKKKPFKSEASNTHAGHRRRLRQRAKEEGLMNFCPHEVLELLLFYSIPQKNTNPIAHQLLERFGSLSAVFDAHMDDLLQVDGISENSATLLNLIPALSRAYMLDRNQAPAHLHSIQDIGNYLINYYIGMTVETPVVLLLNGNCDLIVPPVPLPGGTVTEVTVSPRAIAELVFRYNAAAVVLAHNHPDGDTRPSASDISLTEELRDTLKRLNIQFLDHVIVGRSGYMAVSQVRWNA